MPTGAVVPVTILNGKNQHIEHCKHMMNREQMLQQLEAVPEWDMLIIGGGATGLGAAVDAASRGYKTVLLEQSDFAKGTSSRSTKLVHGGVRYLAQGNVKLVREALEERGLLLKNAPHVCHNISFIIPSFRWWEKWYYLTGLAAYDLLSGKHSLGKTRLLSKSETKNLLPALSPLEINGGVAYQDGQFDDARLAINLAQTAEECGATVLNYCQVMELTKTGKRISGVRVSDIISGKHYEIKCKTVINATGVFTDKVMLLDDAGHQPIISLSQGVHLVVDKKHFPGITALMIPKTDDNRVLFAVPWHDKVVLGTTDTPMAGAVLDPVPLQEEIDFIIQHINRYLSTDIQTGDICSIYAGLRPLVKKSGQKITSILPRDHTTIVSPAGLVTITGGKWTTYRRMGKHAVDTAALHGHLSKRGCVTADLRIHGFKERVNPDEVLSVYGSDAPGIKALMADNEDLAGLLHPQLPYFKAEVVWAVQHEMAITVDDVLARRTRALFLHARASIEVAPMVAALMAKYMNKTKDWEAQQVADFNHIAANYLTH
jgi:glycerol-3-phosphate dehydrogenase